MAPGSDAETHVAAIIRCEGGEVITFERGEYCAAQKEDSWRIVGTKASLHLGMTAAKGKKILADVSSPDAGVSTQTVCGGRRRVGRDPRVSGPGFRGGDPRGTPAEDAARTGAGRPADQRAIYPTRCTSFRGEGKSGGDPVSEAGGGAAASAAWRGGR